MPSLRLSTVYQLSNPCCSCFAAASGGNVPLMTAAAFTQRSSSRVGVPRERIWCVGRGVLAHLLRQLTNSFAKGSPMSTAVVCRLKKPGSEFHNRSVRDASGPHYRMVKRHDPLPKAVLSRWRANGGRAATGLVNDGSDYYRSAKLHDFADFCDAYRFSHAMATLAGGVGSRFGHWFFCFRDGRDEGFRVDERRRLELIVPHAIHAIQIHLGLIRPLGEERATGWSYGLGRNGWCIAACRADISGSAGGGVCNNAISPLAEPGCAGTGRRNWLLYGSARDPASAEVPWLAHVEDAPGVTCRLTDFSRGRNRPTGRRWHGPQIDCAAVADITICRA